MAARRRPALRPIRIEEPERRRAQHGLLLVSKNHDDFRDLHLLVQAANGRHAGIAIVRADNDPRRNMTDGNQAYQAATGTSHASGRIGTGRRWSSEESTAT